MSNSISVCTHWREQKVSITIGRDFLQVSLADVTPQVGALLEALERYGEEQAKPRVAVAGRVAESGHNSPAWALARRRSTDEH